MLKNSEINSIVEKSLGFKNFINEKNNVFIKNSSGSLSPLLVTSLYKKKKDNILVILDDIEQAGFFYNDLKTILETENNLLFFPSTYRRSPHFGQKKIENIVFRTETLNHLSEEKSAIIVTYPEALMEKVVTKSTVNKHKIEITIDSFFDVEEFKLKLNNYGFELTDFVYEPGQFSIRGGIVDVFSFASDNPYRIALFGDEVESIRVFDIETQLSIEKIEKVILSPNFTEQTTENLTDFFSLLNSGSDIFLYNINYLKEKIGAEYKALEEAHESSAEGAKTPSLNNFITSLFAYNKVCSFRVVEFGTQKYIKDSKEINFDASLQPKFNRNFDLIFLDLEQKILDGYEIYILYNDEKQKDRLANILSENKNIYFQFIKKVLHKGFIIHDIKKCFYTDHEIFGRYHKSRVKSNISQKKALITLKEINSLQRGDYVVHVEYGVGVFRGLHTMTNINKKYEVIKVEYKDGDMLYVNIHSLHKISKYKSKDGLKPTIHKLGSKVWQSKKAKVQKKLKEIAIDLINLYAKRKMDKAFAFSPDTFLQEELEASFLYEDTPDQLTTTIDVKKDMESTKTMDRLVCGDVGFGKTEIAIRAAFKAVCDNKQVAVLVPTTVLAFQHYRSFVSRLKRFPCRVDYLSRFRTAKEITQIKKDLKKGEINIIIGTHGIVNKNIEYKDLGLLIVDEEQKFGVGIKEKLKELKENIDTLTLTATPIPRTLQFSLMGARDISIIKTPPPNRIPISTELHTFNTKIIREAIVYEVERGGQVFFVHNRVQNIEEVQAMIHKIVPGINSVVVHGQMSGPQIEKRLLGFVNGEYDVLIATTIIENGIDIPNANTIIINKAQHFGLSDLHQMRGRVGRSNKKAFCYLIAPELHTLSKESRQRLKVITEYSELGSGMNIAMQDLDIRGAGNVFGAEQSGFIADVGYETYMKILNETVAELKQNEFKHVYEDEENGDDKKSKFVSECQVDTDMEIMIPETYISNVSERITIYRSIDILSNIEELDKKILDLEDKFGKIPQQVLDLFGIVKLRWLAMDLGIEKIVLKESKMICYFVSDSQSEFYSSDLFVKILGFVQKQINYCELKEGKRLMMKFQKIVEVRQAIRLLKMI